MLDTRERDFLFPSLNEVIVGGILSPLSVSDQITNNNNKQQKITTKKW
jgi:hypothetical protein